MLVLHATISPSGEIKWHEPGTSIHCNAPGVCQKLGLTRLGDS